MQGDKTIAEITTIKPIPPNCNYEYLVIASAGKLW
jgi:hypothetical protein